MDQQKQQNQQQAQPLTQADMRAIRRHAATARFVHARRIAKEWGISEDTLRAVVPNLDSLSRQYQRHRSARRMLQGGAVEQQ